MGLTRQLRRSAASIGANIAVAWGRGSDGEFRLFLQDRARFGNPTGIALLVGKGFRFSGLTSIFDDSCSRSCVRGRRGCADADWPGTRYRGSGLYRIQKTRL
ncbi:MAG: hypothetical protein DMG70_14710 [Acidobacteria bacterium]|nr:MAG: hypothetical protein DMG70_14710 [Acidobacteriota bacterium]